MDTVKKLSKVLPLSILIITSLVLAADSLPDTNEWAPDKVTVTIPPDRQNPSVTLEWRKTPTFRSSHERIVRGIEAELIFPELKRVGAERYYPTNRLKNASVRRLPETCYYQDNYFLDRCENWTLGIDTSSECLIKAAPREIEINYTGTIPPPAARLAN
jgi:hypothetical protein